MWLKQNTAGTIYMGPFVGTADGFTPQTGLTISQGDILLSKNGGAWAQISGTANATHGTNGWYSVTLGTGDTDTLGRLQIAIYETGGLPVWDRYMVVPANSYDSLVSGTDYLDVTPNNGTVDVATAVTNAVTVSGGTVAAVSGTVSANAIQISGSGPAADNLEASALGIAVGSAVAGTLTVTQMTTSLSEASPDHFNGRVVVWTSGNLIYQASAITDYDGSTKTVTYLTITEAPSEGDTFVIV